MLKSNKSLFYPNYTIRYYTVYVKAGQPIWQCNGGKLLFHSQNGMHATLETSHPSWRPGSHWWIHHFLQQWANTAQYEAASFWKTPSTSVIRRYPAPGGFFPVYFSWNTPVSRGWFYYDGWKFCCARGAWSMEITCLWRVMCYGRAMSDRLASGRNGVTLDFLEKAIGYNNHPSPARYKW